MDPSLQRYLESMRAAGVRRIPVEPGDSGRRRPRRVAGQAAGRSPRGADGPGADRDGPAPALAACPAGGGAAPASADELLAALVLEVEGCTRCKLAPTRSRTVPGEGSPAARIVFVGEGPGADEDRTGRPFVGRAGQLLDDIIVKGMRRQRQDVYICNVVKCRPPSNRVPEPDEVDACADYLDRQLLAIRPAVICALGATAAQRLLGEARPLGQQRGRTHAWQGIPVIVTYHPAYLLRNPAAKKPAWEDIQRVMALAGDGSG